MGRLKVGRVGWSVGPGSRILHVAKESSRDLAVEEVL